MGPWVAGPWVAGPCLAGLCLAGCIEPRYGERSGDALASDARAARDSGHDAARAPADARVEEAASDELPDTGEPASLERCGPEGTQVLRIESQVEWDPASLSLLGIPVETVHGGTGRVSIVALSDSVRSADGWVGKLRPCWGEVPDFAAFDRKFGVYLPEQQIERIPRTWTTTMRASCTRPDCLITSDLVTVELGIALPERGVWPARDAPLDPAVLVDEEGDGKPGITAHVRGPGEPGGYSYVTLPSLEQIDRLYLALRLSSDLLGRITACDVAEGTGTRPELSLRAIGCRTVSGRDCTPEEVALANANLPDFRVPRFTWHSQRAPDGITCEQARQLSGVGQ